MKTTQFLILSLLLFLPTSLFSQSLGDARELYAAGNWDTAKEAYSDLYKKGDPNIQVEAALEISGILWEQGQYAKALKWTQTTKELIQKTGKNELKSRRLFTLGNILASKGKFGKSYSTLQFCQKEARKYKDLSFEVLCRISARFVRQLQGKSTTSKKQYQSDLKKLKSTGQPMLVGTALAKTASLRDSAGRYGDAIHLLKMAHGQFKISKSDPALARNKLRMAAVYQNAGQWSDSKKQLAGLVSTFRNMNNKPALVTLYSLKGRQAQYDGDSKAAKKYLTKAQVNASSLSSPQIRAQVDLGFCELYTDAQHLNNAQKYCDRAYENFSKIGLWTLAARSKIMLGGLAQSRSELELAAQSYKSALGILERIGNQTFVKRDIAFQKTNYCQVSWELKRAEAPTICLNATRSFGGIKKDATVYNAMAKAHYILAHLKKKKKEKIANFKNAARLFEKGGQPARSADALLRAAERMKAKVSVPLLNKALGLVTSKAIIKNRIPEEVRINILTHLSEDLMELSQWKDALENLNLLKNSARRQKDWTSLSWAHNARARVLLKTKGRPEALTALRECIDTSKKAHDKTQEDLCEENLKKLSK